MSRWKFKFMAPGHMRGAIAAVSAALLLAGCSAAPQIAPADQPLTKQSLMLLGKKGMRVEAPIFVRIFKEESELEVWKQRDDGRFYHFKSYPICNWSGDLGPKVKQGDKQAPEGFYRVANNQLNPNSQFHVSFNLGYPNAYDKALGRTGDFLMVHGKCKSAGCYAMTDALIEEIYGVAREALKGGQQSFDVHAFPFRMTDENMQRHAKSKWIGFWRTLKQGYDQFEVNRVPPPIAICEHRYIVNVASVDGSEPQADAACPTFRRPQMQPFTPKPTEQQIASERIEVPGPRMRTAESIRTPEGEEWTPPAVAYAGSGSGSTFSRMFGLGGTAAPQTKVTGYGYR